MHLPSIDQSAALFPDAVTAGFHQWYRSASDTKGPPRVSWLGTDALKCPLDLWIYQEILTDYRPDVIIEGGTASGGSALFLATVCEALQHGRVVTIDCDADPGRPQHGRITYLTGDTLADETLHAIRRAVGDAPRRMLILDDGHSKEHVAEELRRFAPLLRPGDWLVVEDTNLGGPYWGLQEFLLDEPEGAWVRQPACERLLLTFNPWGYWRRA